MLKTYQLINQHNMQVRVLNFGASLISVMLPNGIDVCLHYDDINDYTSKPPVYLGSSIGPIAGRIAQAQFELNGTTYPLASNSLGKHNLHSGPQGLAHVIWQAKVIEPQKLILRYHSQHNEWGFPGNTTYTCVYTLTDENQLIIDYLAQSDQDTIVNLTNHVYWNLAGSDTILNHQLQIDSDCYVVADAELIPTGKIAAVSHAVDFRQPKIIGHDIEAVAPGYDHCYVLADARTMKCCAEVYAPETMNRLRIYTTQPAVQFYTGNYLPAAGFATHQGFCLETQNYPDAIHHAHFPSPILKAGEQYHQSTRFEFSL